MTKPKAKAEQKKEVLPYPVVPADIREMAGRVQFSLKPSPFVAGKAADDFATFVAANINHSALRISSLEAKVNGDNPTVAIQKADEAFGGVAPFIFVQCPYCHIPLHAIDNVHLANCPEVQKRYSGKTELWTTGQCLKDFPDTQMRSWLASYVAHLSAMAPSPVAETSPLPPRPAVVDKRKGLNAIKPKIRVVGQPIRVQPQVAAVVQRKGFVPPRMQRGFRR